ncbi:MFS transporter [Megasphaera paucivorans]|uniref:Sugar phosphate permease n=1 Tax=Megasphaera paucivorans TaxID=349095 RepID=A0A1H0B7X9_9FIRM|nr:MFS transporter [Megasphaera paucivorans]SDN41767.1 Sugar phosphate permease [Megasphaera paucivorans]
MSEKVKTVCHTPMHRTHYRWIVLAIIFAFYMMNFADRANLGVVLPTLKSEFVLTNMETGALMSFFFLGYAITQIPAGLFMSKVGPRGIVATSIMGFSVFTFLIGASVNAFMMKWFRFGLGLFEGPSPVGGSATIKNWYPPQEQGFASGVFMGATSLALIAVPPASVWILLNYGWRMVFWVCAIPGCILSIIWYFFVHGRPEDSPYCNQAEVDYIHNTTAIEANGTAELNTTGSLGWVDKLIRASKMKQLETNMEVFKSWDIWGNALTYFFVGFVTYGLMTWIPSYLVNGRGFSFIKMGWVASSPWVGALVGQLLGGWISDKWLYQRRKPNMIFGPICLIIMLIVLIHTPDSTSAWVLSIILFLTGGLLNMAWPSYWAYPMGFTTGKTYPTAISIMTTVGNLSGFFSPLIGGYLLDVYQDWNVVFIFLGVCAALSILMSLTIKEPLRE